MHSLDQSPARGHSGVLGLLALAVALGAGLAACGGSSSSSSNASVRVVNATLTHPSIDLLVSAAAATSATVADTAGAYASAATGGAALQLDDAGVATALVSTSPSLAADQHYALVAYESGGTVKAALLNEDTALPAAGSAQLRVYDTAPDAGTVDVYITDPGIDLAAVAAPTLSISADTYPTSSVLLTYSPGTYRVRVTGSANKADLRLDMPAVVLTSQQLATVVLTPASGGLLLNGGLLQQQGAYAATRNTTARVRLAAAVSGGALVGASVGAATVDAGSPAPNIGSYTVVPAAGVVAVSVGGVGLAAPAAPLAAGSDYTLLVYGAGAAATATLVTDDNRLPASAANLKMRLVNGVTGATSPLTLSANFSPLAAGVQPGSASGYGLVAGSSAMRLDVTSALSAAAVYSESALNLPGNAVYTLFMVGDAGTPTHVLRRDR